MSKAKIIIDNGYFFILSLLLFTLNSILVTVLVAQGYRNTSELYSLFFTGAGFLIIIKSFISAYANMAYSIKHSRWYVLVANTLLVSLQFTCFYLGLIWFREDTYPRITVTYFLAANLGLIAQITLGKLTSSIKYQMISIALYAVLAIMLYTQLFNADVRFLQVISVISVAVEIALTLNLYRTFQQQETVTIAKDSLK